MTLSQSPSVYTTYTVTLGRSPPTLYFYNGPYTVTLPDATLMNGKQWQLVIKTTQKITFQTVKNQLIDNATTLVSTSNNQIIQLTSNGVNWVPTWFLGRFPFQREGDGQIVNTRLSRLGTV